ncbi:MAG: IS110 family transposase [Theionarchaea archaeon]|nr:IS110 family transposase [Theionarchaea archaeon]
MIYTGIDIHKKVCAVCLKDEKGKILREFQIRNTREGIGELLRSLRGREASVVMESTSTLWMKLYDALEDEGIPVVLANPYKTRVIAESKLKNDKVDAAILADLLRADMVASSYVPEKEVREVRELIRYRQVIKGQTTATKNRIHSLLNKYDLTFEGTDLFGKKGRAWFRTIIPQVRERDAFVLEKELSTLDHFSEILDEIEGDLAQEAVEREDVHLLMSITGVDFFTALLFLYEVGDISRFPTASHLSSWVGLVPRVHQSGDTLYHGRITKQGNALVRWALVQAAHAAVRWDPQMAAFYNRINARKGKKKAIVAVARKLSVVIYHMLKKGERYYYFNPTTYVRKLKRLHRIAGVTPNRLRMAMVLSTMVSS